MTRALVAAAGTGGHVFPALAVAKQLQHNGWHVDWLGTEEGRLESRVVPANGINLHRIAMTGVRGHGLLRLVKAPLLLASAVRQCQRLLKQLRPDIVVTFGGYVCAPLGIAAKLAGIPLLVHEQNAVPGMTTRLLAPIATVVMAGLPLRKKVIKRAQWVGNPLRRDIEQLAQRPLPDSASGHPIKLLVVGGSLGAQVLNEVVPEALQNIEQQLTGAHQCGEGKAETVTARYQQLNRQPLQVVEFIDDMAAAYDAADLVICRAGALTVSELAALGKPAIFVPLPHAVDDHQTENARVMVEAGAARLIPQAELTATSLAKELQSLLQQPQQLWKMARFARQCARPDATEAVAQLCIDAVRNRTA